MLLNPILTGTQNACMDKVPLFEIGSGGGEDTSLV